MLYCVLTNLLCSNLQDIIDFFARNMVNKSLGGICNAHVVCADLSQVGALDEKCISLAELAVTAVRLSENRKSSHYATSSETENVSRLYVKRGVADLKVNQNSWKTLLPCSITTMTWHHLLNLISTPPVSHTIKP